jgi:uncharacterized protein YpiB (UPF0302 family)
MGLSVQDKRSFIQWILNNYQLRRRECHWIMNYLIGSDRHLDNVVFIDTGTSFAPIGLHITDHNTHKRCKFYFHGVTTDDMEKAFHAIRNYGIDDKVYIRFDLDFKDEDRIKFLNAVEDNPHIPKRTGALAEMSRKAEIFMHSAMHSFERERLHEQIDEALVSGNKELFIELTAKLKTVQTFDTIEIIKDKDRFHVKDGV